VSAVSVCEQPMNITSPITRKWILKLVLTVGHADHDAEISGQRVVCNLMSHTSDIKHMKAK
jgi:hypothetical protein